MLIDRLSHISKSELLILWISIFLILSAAIGTILAYFHLNNPMSFLLAAIVLSIGLHSSKLSSLKNYFKYCQNRVSFIFSKIPTWKGVIAFSVTLPLLLAQMRPTNETDSLFNLNFIFDWLYNGNNPYWMNSWNPASWEVTYLPSLIISKSDVYFWMTSFLAVVLIGFGIYKIGRELGISGRLSWLTAFSTCMFFELWYNPSGIGTIKQDMIYAASVLLIVLAIIKSIKNDSKKTSLIFFTIGAIFVLAKESGVAIIVFGIILTFFFNWKKILKLKKKTVFYCILAFSAIMAISGHYYLHKLFEWGNPFYPYLLTVFGHPLGQYQLDFSGTTIFSSIHDPQLYQYLLFNPDNILRAGLLFPVLVVLGYIGAPIIACVQFYRIIAKKSNNRNLLFLAIFVFLTWIVYLFHFVGASSQPGDLFYVKTLGSIRYVEGTVFLTELFLVYILWICRLPRNILLAIIGINLLSRLVYNYQNLPYSQILNLGYLPIIIPMVVAAALLIMRKSSRIKIISIVIFSILIASFFISPEIVDKNRAFWIPQWDEVIQKIYYQQPSKIFLAYQTYSDGGSEYWTITYPFHGNQLQHSVTVITEKELFSFLNTHNSESYPDFIVEVCNPNISCKIDLTNFATKVKNFNYEIQVLEDKELLLHHI